MSVSILFLFCSCVVSVSNRDKIFHQSLIFSGQCALAIYLLFIQVLLNLTNYSHRGLLFDHRHQATPYCEGYAQTSDNLSPNNHRIDLPRRHRVHHHRIGSSATGDTLEEQQRTRRYWRSHTGAPTRKRRQTSNRYGRDRASLLPSPLEIRHRQSSHFSQRHQGSRTS